VYLSANVVESNLNCPYSKMGGKETVNILSNAFSLQMIAGLGPVTGLRVEEILPEEVPVDCISNVGHQDFAVLVGSILGRVVAFDRVSTRLQKDDVLFVAQYIGTRLPEGCSTLPAGAEIRFFRISVSSVSPRCRVLGFLAPVAVFNQGVYAGCDTAAAFAPATA
jgi:hypothetical protein